MPGIDESLPFFPLRIAVLTISDTRDAESDRSGALLVERLTGGPATSRGFPTLIRLIDRFAR